MRVGRMATANAPIAQWDDFLEESFFVLLEGKYHFVGSIQKGKLMFKIVISMKNEYCTEPKKY